MLSRLHALLRSEPVFLGLTAVLAALAVGAAYAWLGFFGILVLGLMILVGSLRVAIEEDGPTGSGHTPGLYASSLNEAPRGDERLARAGDRERLRRSLRFVYAIGLALVVAGGLGFWWFQLG